MRHWWSLIKNLFKHRNFACYEILTHTAPIPAITFISSVIYIVLLSINAFMNNLSFIEFLNTGAINVIWYFVGVYIMGNFHAFVVIIHDYKRIDCNNIWTA